MSKTKKAKKEIPESSFLKFNIDKIIPERYQTIFLFGVILVIFLIYFSPMYFGNETLNSNDIITSKSLTSYVENHQDGYTLWNPHIFLGMPAYALTVDFKWFNLIYVGLRAVRDTFTAFFSVEYTMWSFYLILLAFTSYLLINYFTNNRLIALFAALATSFSTGLMLFIFIGHVTKLTALWAIPLIFLMLLKFQKEIKLRDFAILTIALQLSVQGWHVQIIFYTLFAVGIYFVYYFIRSVILKNSQNRNQILKSAGVYAGSFLIALLIQSDNLTQIYQWNPYSTRGTESIVDIEKGKDPKKADSEFYEYATNWSFSPEETATFIIPSFYGFGKIKYKSEITRGQEVELNTYFGQMPMVDVAMYMGVVVFFLALYSIFANWKNPFVQFLTIVSVIALLISFGRTFPLVYDLMFYYFPFFDKFRVPSMILILLQISVPVLAALGIKNIIELRNQKNKKAEENFKYFALVISGFFIVSIILSGSIENHFASRFADSEKGSNLIKTYSQYGLDITTVAKELYSSDVIAVMAFLTISAWAVYGFLRRKLSKDLLIIILAGITLFDLIRVNNRAATYTPDVNIEGLFNQPDYVSFIKQQNDNRPFRIFNIKQDGSLGSFNRNSNYNAYFLLNDFYGYSAIKPRSYQNLMDVVGPINQTLWNMTNVKYIISDQALPVEGLKPVKQFENAVVSINENSLPRAFFVNKVERKAPMEILNLIKGNEFNPENIAYADIGDLTVETPDSNTYVKTVSYKDEKIELDVNASGNNYLVLSDTYYPNGWHAYVDGNETQIYRTNHALRGIIVPEGKHKVEFIYAPISFTISKYLALVLSSAMALLLIFGVWRDFPKKLPEKEDQE